MKSFLKKNAMLISISTSVIAVGAVAYVIFFKEKKASGSIAKTETKTETKTELKETTKAAEHSQETVAPKKNNQNQNA